MSRVGTILRVLVLAGLVGALVPTVALGVTANQPVLGLSFLDASTGYIVGGEGNSSTGHPGFLSWTKNGGASWHAQSVPSRQMTSVTAKAGGATALPTGWPPSVFTTTNLGLSWDSAAFTPAAKLWDMAELTGNRRVVVGEWGQNGGVGLIATSIDGEAWSETFRGPLYSPPSDDQEAPQPHSVMTSIDAVSGGNVAWIVGYDWASPRDAQGPYLPLVYKTVDAGATWTTQTVDPGGPPQSADATPALNCVTAVDSNYAFIGRADRKLLRTSDGGDTWDLIDMQIASGFESVKAIDAYDKDHVLVVGYASNGSGRMAWTSNAQAPTPVWTPYTPVAPNGALFSAQMLSLSNWIVAGNNETILRTTDSGATWTGSKSALAPWVTITSPARATILSSPNLTISGVATDQAGVGVAKVEVRVQRRLGESWDGSAWVSSDVWLPAIQSNPANGWDAWNWSDALTDFTTETSVTVSARATDGLGLVSTLNKVSSLADSAITATKPTQTIAYGGTATLTGKLTSGGVPLANKTVAIQPSSKGTTVQTDLSGNYTFSVKPNVKTTYTLSFAGDSAAGATSVQAVVTPKAKVTTPVVPSYVKRSKSFKVYTYLYPKHTTGTTVMTYYFQKKNSKGKYVTISSETVTAKAAAFSSARSKVTSPYVKLSSGKWRVVARHADSGHASTDSPRKYFTVH